jgi:hypothetical protein
MLTKPTIRRQRKECMMTYSMPNEVRTDPRRAARSAGVAAIAAALAGFAYAVAFVLLSDPLLASVFLLLSGALAVPALVALGDQLRQVDPVTAGSALLLALAGALGSAVHGGYDLANVLHPPAVALGDAPNPVDPRGLLTFGLAGIGIFVLGTIIVRSRRLPRALGYVACINGALLLALYLGRLIILDPTSPLILLPAVATGFLLNPVLYGWLGVHLLRGEQPASLGR